MSGSRQSSSGRVSFGAAFLNQEKRVFALISTEKTGRVTQELTFACMPSVAELCGIIDRDVDIDIHAVATEAAGWRDNEGTVYRIVELVKEEDIDAQIRALKENL
jgi:hypothetical protein